jgi:glycosyltransferase involved in cell wall biosynthesis
MNVAILLCTFNGAKYVKEQLNSLLSQSYPHWTCYVFDDQSNDDTVAILREYADRHPNKFRVMVNKVASGSASKNFSSATNYALKNFVFDLLCYCDQDDVWLPEKLAVLSAKFADCPDEAMLVFSDLSVVDSELQLIESSFVSHISVWNDVNRHINSELISVDNIVPGCSLMCNKALLAKAVPISPRSVMHDWWLVLVALRLGKIVFVPSPLVLYRQHEANSVGAKKMGLVDKLRRMPRVWNKLSAILKMHSDMGSGERSVVLIGKYVFVKLYKFLRY